ncbi:MAG TPA: histidine phosphatase family protein [Chitinophagaceae bacterium]|nr:histidine phosphatase family protein [Chitinophagaceae bacterium]
MVKKRNLVGATVIAMQLTPLLLSAMKYFTCLLAGVLLLLCGNSHAQTTSRVFIVRHADRQTEDDLNPAGITRANELKRVLLQTGIDSIFSTNFVRTKKTVGPLAEALHLPVITYDSNPPLVQRLRAYNKGKTVLVAGHSNTVLPLVTALGCSAGNSTIPSGQFDDLFLVILEYTKKGKRTTKACRLLHMKYGAATD